MSLAAPTAQAPDGSLTEGASDAEGEAAGFAEFLDRTVGWLADALAGSIWKPATWRARPWDPERRKLFGRLIGTLSDLRVADRAGELDSASRTRLTRLLEARQTLRSTDSTLEVVDEATNALLSVADDDFLVAVLVDERARELSRAEPDATPGGSTQISWSYLYPDVSIDDFLRADERRFPSERVRRLLAALYRCRRERYRLHRARMRMKENYLLLLALVLLPLDVVFAVLVAEFAGAGGYGHASLAAAAGAVGALVSGAFRLRGMGADITNVRAFKPTLWVQPLLGAAAGLVLLLALASGLVGTDVQPAGVGVIAFAAGFSEPFFLGIVGRVASIPDGRSPPSRGS